MSESLRLLLLEDSATDADLIERALRKAGIELNTVRVDTLAAFAASLDTFTPDLILADYRLPDGDGLQAVAVARAKTSDTPCLIVTGTMDEELAAASIALGATDYVLKDRLARLPVAVRRALAEKAQRAQRRADDERFRAFFDNAMVGMATTSPAKGWTMANPALCDMLGYRLEELRTKTWAELTHPDDLAGSAAGLARMVAGDSDGYSAEKRYLRKDGTILYGFVTARAVRRTDGSIDFIATTIEDISERRLAEQTLCEQRELEQCLIASTSRGILTYRESGQCVIANAAAARISGAASVDQLMAQNFHHIASWRDSGLYAAAQAALAENSTVWVTVNHASSFGKHLWIECTLSIFRAREQRHLLLILNDVTERVQTERIIRENLAVLRETNRKLADAQGQLLQSEKLAAIGQLAAGVAHEINNPVGFVTSNLGSLEAYVKKIISVVDAYESVEHADGAASPAFAPVRNLRADNDFDYIRKDVIDLLAESKEGLGRVRKIVHDLKDFSRVGDQDWQWADLHACLDSTLNIVWNELKYKAQVLKDYAADLPEIYCLPSQLNQVFMNLLVNAAQAIEQRGTITLRTGRADGFVWIEVEDSGKGIVREHVNRIFEPFFTTKPVGQGTGLGLSLVHGIVKRHDGRIDVQSEVGSGSRFRVTLPVRLPLGDNTSPGEPPPAANGATR